MGEKLILTYPPKPVVIDITYFIQNEHLVENVALKHLIIETELSDLDSNYVPKNLVRVVSNGR